MTSASDSPVAPGTSLGRYQLLEVIGEGGMGIVYSAYDPELDRKIALKLLHSKPQVPSDPGEYDRVRERLKREAQTMARLSHPNIVTVFDVGMANGQLFIAMELIEGGTLAAHLEARKRSDTRSVAPLVELFIAAGRGLQAAHAAGFVHRDFKPANVLVGTSGRVCVTDFGLARIADGAAPCPPSSQAVQEPSGSITETGLVLGTSAYMAPEQLRSEAVDARSDQFSFCVALYEALYGELPFAVASLDERRAAIEAGAVREPRRGVDVPQWLRRAVLRGLSPRAGDRYPSLTALLSDLERGGARKWRPRLLAVAALLLLAVIVVSYRARQRAPLASQIGAEQVAAIRDPQARARIHVAFSASGKPYAEETFRAVERGLDGFADAWQRMYIETREANRRGQESSVVMDLRIDCLKHRLDEAAELTSLFDRADGKLVEHAAQAVQGLSDLTACADVSALQKRQAPPTDPLARAAYDALERRLAQVKTLGHAERYAEGKLQIGAIVKEAERLDHPVLSSDALFWQGIFQRFTGEPQLAERSLARAAAAAERGADDGCAASAWDQLALMTAQDTSRGDDAERWLAHGAAAHERAGPDAEREALHERAAAEIALTRNRLGEEATALKRSIELYARAGDIVGEAEAASSSGFVLALGGRLAEGEADCERSRRLVENNLGREHPSVSSALFCFGFTSILRLRFAEATAILLRTIALEESAYGRDSPWTIATWHMLIESLIDAEHLDAAQSAIAHTEESERRVRVNPLLMASTSQLKGRILLKRGHPREALPLLEASYQLISHKGNDSLVANTAWCLARALWESGGDRARAVELAKEAQDLLVHLGPAPAYLAMRLTIWNWLRNHAPN